jgi:hypothetical protein
VYSTKMSTNQLPMRFVGYQIGANR